MKRFITIFLCMIIISIYIIPGELVSALTESSTYELYQVTSNGNQELVGAYSTFSQANEAMTSFGKAKNSNTGYTIIQNGQIKSTTYGLVNFRTKGDSNTTTFTEEATGRNVSVSVSHGADAAFLGTNEDGTLIRFKMSGVIGWVNASEVELIDITTSYTDIFTSSYIAYQSSTTTAPELIHNVATLLSSSKMSEITLGQEIPKGLKISTKSNRTYYLSYDGIYFYEESLAGYKKMIDDYKTGTHGNAINANDPYYNYYMYLSHRSISNYTADNIAQYLSDYTAKPLAYPAAPNESLLYGEGNSFIQNQNEYGSNAIMMLGVSINESAYGRSAIAIRTNNIFGHNAVDSDPGGSASGYDKVSNSIKTHAKKYVSEGYLDPCDSRTVNGDGTSSSCHLGRYFGSNLGNKAGGLNVKYASDPYWGEKAARNYYYFDKSFGLQDFGKYSIGIKENDVNYPIKASANNSSATLYTTGKTTHYPILILETTTGEMVDGNDKWYKIQTDPTLNANRTGIVQDQGEYDFNHNIGYIHSNAIAFVRAGKDIKNTYTIQFDPAGGIFPDGQKNVKKLTVEEFTLPTIEEPTKEGYRFIGWDKEILGATENAIYTAIYEPIVITYQITFLTNGGRFSDGTISKKVTTNKGVIPTIEEPIQKGYIFTGWNPKVTEATKNTVYQATWEKEGEVEPKEVDGNFYFEYLKQIDGQLKLKGYLTINGMNNTLDVNIDYELWLEDIDQPNHIIVQKLNRIKTESSLGRPAVGTGNYNYQYSWFDGNISISELEQGNYRLYVVAKSKNLYSKSVVNNLLYKEQATYFKQKKSAIIRTNYSNDQLPIEMIIRDNEIGKKESLAMYSEYDQFRNLSFDDKKQLNILGYSYSYGLDYGKNVSVKRDIIFENKNTFQTYHYSIGSITTGLFELTLPQPDGYDKTRAWYQASLDISNIPVGEYVIYISNQTNISDFGELKDLLYKDLSNIKMTANGKEYSFIRNDKMQHRIELIVK